MNFNRFDILNLVDVEFRAETRQVAAAISAYNNNVLLPGVVLVGRDESRLHESARAVVDQSGQPITMEDRQRIASARRASQVQDFRKDGSLVLDDLKHADRFLPKAFRAVKPRELEITEEHHAAP